MMIPRIPVTDSTRAVPSGLQPSVPLVTLAWRALRAEHGRQAAAAQSQEERGSRMLRALAEVAEQNWRLRRSIRAAASASDGVQSERLCGEQLAISEQLEQILSAVGLTVLAPEGQPYAGEIMHLFDNVAQRADEMISAAEVAEILTPAILYQDELLRMGKAVVRIPGAAIPASGNSSTDHVSTTQAAGS